MANPLDPAGLYQRYKNAQVGRGLGDLFQEEGPGLGPSSDYILRPNMDKSLGTLALERGLAGQIKDLRRKYPKQDFPELEEYIQDIRGTESKRREKSMKPSGLKAELAKIRRLQENPSEIVPLSAELPEKSPAYEMSPLDEIAAQLEKINSPNGAGNKDKAQTAEAFREEEARRAGPVGRLADDVDPVSDVDPKDIQKTLDQTFASAMDDFIKSVRGAEPDKKERTLDEYKRDFAEATGVDISGKVDISSTLMSLGLALMQNRAGSGFNVGKMLSALGAAGEKALPALEKAKEKAQSAAIAAGKYALQMIKSDEDARDAIKASNAALRKELLLKDLEYKRDRQLLIDEAILSGDEAKLTEALKNTEQKTIRVGAQEVKIGLGQDIEFGGRSVFSSPGIDARIVADAYKKTGQGLDLLRQMEGLLFRLKDQGEGSFGGTALQGVLENVISIGNSMGMNIEYPSGDDVALTKQLDVLQKQVLSRFKKFIAQETGNGISNVDVKDIKEALGNFETFEDIDKAIMSVSKMQDLFLLSQNTLDPIVDMFMDRRSYRGNEVGTESYENVVKMFSESFGNVSLIQPTIVEGPNGQKIIDYDIRTGV